MTDGPISSLTNPRIKAAVRLRDRRERERTGLTLVDGARELLRALEAGVELDHVFACEDLVHTADAELVLDRLRTRHATVIDVTETVLAKVAFGDRSDGLVAVVRAPTTSLADLRLPAEPLVVIVESIEKPGNLGAVLRSADGAGANAVIAADPRTDVFNPNAIRASLGTIFTLPVVTATSTDALDWLVAAGVRPVAARVDAPTDYTDAELRGPVALILGSEVGGLTTTWHVPRVEAVRIPMLGVADSLNVSVAAAVLLYEARRQRDRHAGKAD